MDNSIFISHRTYTRIKYEPLTTSCSLVCTTPLSPATQSIIAAKYEPDRKITPTIILPDVRVTDPSHVFGDGSANANIKIDTIAWTVNGERIEDVWADGVDYEINITDTETRGALKIMKNIPVSENAVIRFTGEFLDWRTGTMYTVESDDMALTCVDTGAESFIMSVDKPIVEYDPFFDNLLRYDYKVARGIHVYGARRDFIDGKCFEQTVSAILTRGSDSVSSLPSGYSFRVVRLGEGTPLEAGSETSPEIISIAFPSVTFDMRQIDRGDYEVQVVDGDKVVARATVGLHTQPSMPTDGKLLRMADISQSQDIYSNSVLLNIGDNIVDYPELFYLIKWLTVAKYNDNGTWKYDEQKEWQHGEYIYAPIYCLGIGEKKNNSFFDIMFNLDAHKALNLLTDEYGNVLADEKGDFLIG